MTEAQLRKMLPHCPKARADLFFPHVGAAMTEFGINTPVRMAAFIAQVAHESGEFLYVKELASGREYEGRHDLGNVHPGDGARFKGRGLIQITGRFMYAQVAKALRIDCLNHPELLEQPANACRSAAWFWNLRHLSPLADHNSLHTFAEITQHINGGLNGEADRVHYWRLAEDALGLKHAA